MEDKSEEVEFLREVRVSKSTNTEGEGVMSGGLNRKKTKGSKGQNKRDNEGRKLNLATVPRIYM